MSSASVSIIARPAPSGNWTDLLCALPGPTHIQLLGRDGSRCRVVVTLSHGNEPSGLSAVHALLRQGIEPTVDIHIFIVNVNVDAARAQPFFSHRMLPGDRDLNRCFKAPFGNDRSGVRLSDGFEWSFLPGASVDCGDEAL